jgi:fatty acid synthase, animal type
MERLLSIDVQHQPVVISGISGRFPRSRNMKEFAKNLFDKLDMIDDDESRWKHFNPSIPRRFGKISDLEKFDASFFSYLDKHAAKTDPQTRMLLEHSYEAILDAGVSPQSLFGSKTGVFVASMMLDSKDAFFHDVATKEGQGGSFVRYF